MKAYQALFDMAATVREHSYSPISHFKVGAALMTAHGTCYAGTNVEDAGFNSTTHAEQSAIAVMVAEEGRQVVKRIVVVSDSSAAPCGHCRQLLLEFAKPDMEIIVASPDGTIRLDTKLSVLIPHAFRMDDFC